MCTRVQQPVPHVYTFLTGKHNFHQQQPGGARTDQGAVAVACDPRNSKVWGLRPRREREDKVCLARVSVRGWYNTQGLTHWGRGGPGLSLMSSRLDTEHKYRDRTKSASSSPALPCCPRPSPFYPRPCNAFPIPSPPCSVINLFSQNSTGDWNGY